MSERKLLLGTWVFLAAHILWLLGRYALAFPIWGDEAFVVRNFSDTRFLDLFSPLANGQVAPLLWLWLEKFCFNLSQGSVLAMRLPSVLAGIASTWLMLRFCLRALPQPSAFFGFAIFCASYYPLRHAVEIKPYSTDLLFALLQLNLALDLFAAGVEESKKKGLALLGVSLLGVWMSYPSLFVSAALGPFLLWKWRRNPWSILLGLGVYAGAAFWMIVSFALPHAQAAAWLQEMEMWKTAFPPLHSWWTLPYWLLERHCGYLSAYPTGGRHFGSSLSFALILLGAIAFWRRGRRAFLWILLGPLLFNLVAAMDHRYPYGGSVRVSIFMAPAFCLLMGHGLVVCLQKLPSPLERWGQSGILALLFSFLALGLVRDIQKPYKSLGDRQAQVFAQWLAAHHDGPTSVLGWCNQKAGVPDFHGLGGSMARMRVQVEQAQVPIRWMDRSFMQGLYSLPTSMLPLWVVVYTDDNNTAMPYPLPEFLQSLPQAEAAGWTWVQTEFPIENAEQIDVFRFSKP